MDPLVYIEPATMEHARILAPLMRQADVDEVMASHGYTPIEALEAGVNQSEVAWAGFLNGDLVGLFGISRRPFLSTTAVPWLLTGVGVEKHPRAFWKACRVIVADWREQFAGVEMEQFVDARHERALRWAARLGFHVEPAMPFGAAGLPFHRISMSGRKL